MISSKFGLSTPSGETQVDVPPIRSAGAEALVAALGGVSPT
jgi:hypothetical protein